MTTPLQKAVDVFDAQAFDAHRVLAIMAEKFPVEFLKMAAKYPGQRVAPASPIITPAQFNEVQGYLKEGRKVNAIKLVRAEKGIGLKEAKDIVDRVQEKLFNLTLAQIVEVRSEIYNGRHVSAIKWVMEQTGMELRVAKHYVDMIRASMNTNFN